MNAALCFRPRQGYIGPADNDSPEYEYEYECDGITEEGKNVAQ